MLIKQEKNNFRGMKQGLQKIPINFFGDSYIAQLHGPSHTGHAGVRISLGPITLFTPSCFSQQPVRPGKKW